MKLPRVEIETSEGDKVGSYESTTVKLYVPGYEGDVEFQLHVERDADGDWRVFVPWFADLHGNPAADHTDLLMENGVGVTNGICYIGAPDVPSNE